MKTQKGFIDIDFGALFLFLIIVGIGIGWILSTVVPWVWGLIKPFIHMITA